MVSPYTYELNELTENDPRSPQPSSIKVQLKPHQLAAVYKAQQLEIFGKIRKPNKTISTNVGILGDIVGYGKTLTALAIIASTPVDDLCIFKKHVISHYTKNAYCVIKTVDETIQHGYNGLNPTLIVVPHGPVYTQWERTIRNQTTLKPLLIDSLTKFTDKIPPHNSYAEQIIDSINSYDIVLVKDSVIKKLINYYDHYINQDGNVIHPTFTTLTNPLRKWKRIMVDESHNIITSVPNLQYKFVWHITSTYHQLNVKRCTSTTLSESLLCITDSTIKDIVIKGDINFVQSSFAVPVAVEHYYKTVLPDKLKSVIDLLSGKVQELISAGNYKGAIEAMGGDIEHETDIVKTLTQDLEKSIKNKKLEIEFIQGLDIPEQQKHERIKPCKASIESLQTRLESIIERVTKLNDKLCPCCFDTYITPVMLDCTHVFCMDCIVKWFKKCNTTLCPTCKSSVTKRLINIVDDNEVVSTQSDKSTGPVKPLTKDEIVLKLIANKPNGKFLLFSNYDGTFININHMLTDNNVTFCEMKGTSASMNSKLERFKHGDYQMVLLNTQFAGSGIDISCATDVIIYHAMGDSKTQSIGRAQRVGRTTELTIHNICYEHELPPNIIVKTL